MKHSTSGGPQRSALFNAQQDNICHDEEHSDDKHKIDRTYRQSSSFLKTVRRHGSHTIVTMLSVMCALSALFVFVQQLYLSHAYGSWPSSRHHRVADEDGGIERTSVFSDNITDINGLSFDGVSIRTEAEERTVNSTVRDTQQLSQLSVVLVTTPGSKTRKTKGRGPKKIPQRQRQKSARRMEYTKSFKSIPQQRLVDNQTSFKIYQMSHPYPGVLSVHVTGNISYRLKQFNVAVDQLRLQLWNELNAAIHQNTNQSSISDSSLAPDVKFDSVFGYGDKGNDNITNQVSRVPRRWRPWSNDQLLVAGGGSGLQRTQQSSKHVIIVNEDDYLQRLSARFPLVRIIVLPWLSSQQRTKTSPTDELVSWSSRNDTANLFVEVDVLTVYSRIVQCLIN